MANIKDVAKLAGVSISTYLNGGHVRPENLHAIRSAVAQLDYKANPFARGLKANRSYSIGVLLPSIAAPFFGNIVMTMDKVLRERGYHTLISCYDANHGLERDYLRFLLSTGIDALVYIPEDLSADEFYELTGQRSIPVVQIDRVIQGVQSDAVLTDNAESVYSAVTCLLGQEHRRIAIITGPKSVFTAKERLVGYLRALSDHDLPYDDQLVISGEITFTTGHQSFLNLMNMANPPTAIICSNYDITMGVITAAREQGCRLPEDVTVFGFDSLEACSVMTPAVPVIHQPEEEMAVTAANFLLERLDGFDGPVRQAKLKNKLVLLDRADQVFDAACV